MEIPGLDILRKKEFAKKIIESIIDIANKINKPIKLMHVCGTHEHTLSKYGLRELLPKNLEMTR